MDMCTLAYVYRGERVYPFLGDWVRDDCELLDVGLGKELWSSERTLWTLTCWITSLVPQAIIKIKFINSVSLLPSISRVKVILESPALLQANKESIEYCLDVFMGPTSTWYLTHSLVARTLANFFRLSGSKSGQWHRLGCTAVQWKCYRSLGNTDAVVLQNSQDLGQLSRAAPLRADLCLE